MKKYLILCSLPFLTLSAIALDLTKAKFPLFYECHREQSAGLYKDKSTGNWDATVFSVDKFDRWQMKIEVIRNEMDLKSLPIECTYERNARLAAGGRDPRFFSLDHKDKPEYCVTLKVSKGTESMETSHHCEIRRHSDSEIFCRITDSLYFNSDTLSGLETDNSLRAVILGWIKAVDVSRIACIRLDR